MLFKKLPGTTNLLINLKGIIKNNQDQIVDFETDRKGNINIELFGKEQKIKRKFLSLLAWYEVDVIPDIKKHWNKIYFLPASKYLKVSCGYLMTFKEPIVYKEKYRVIPNYPRYAISLDGEIFDIKNNEIKNTSNNCRGYLSVNLESPDKKFRSNHVNIRKHRLLAFAYLPNDDFINRPFINHIDGVKDNNKLSNLEWCSYTENNTHAIRSGLTKIFISMKSRDIITGKIDVYLTAAEMSSKLGMPNVSVGLYTNKLPGYLYKNRYEIKRFDDNTPWFYEDNELFEDHGNYSKYTVTVLNKETGEIKKFPSFKIAFKYYKIYLKSMSKDGFILKLKEKYPELEVSYKRNSLEGPYTVLNLETNKETIISSMLKAADYIKININELNYDLVRGNKFIYLKKWIVYISKDKFNLNDYKEKPNRYSKVLIINHSDKSEIVANSMKHAARLTKMSFKTIKTNIDSGKVTKGFEFRALDQ